MKTDAQVRTDILHELASDPNVGAAHIDVTVERGVVILCGTVPSLGALVAAGKATWRVFGVEAVANGLRIERPDQTRVAR